MTFLESEDEQWECWRQSIQWCSSIFDNLGNVLAQRLPEGPIFPGQSIFIEWRNQTTGVTWVRAVVNEYSEKPIVPPSFSGKNPISICGLDSYAEVDPLFRLNNRISVLLTPSRSCVTLTHCSLFTRQFDLFWIPHWLITKYSKSLRMASPFLSAHFQRMPHLFCFPISLIKISICIYMIKWFWYNHCSTRLQSTSNMNKSG